jgi:hypothetical protein
VQAENLSANARGLRIANNTSLGGYSPFRIWYIVPYEKPVAGQVEVVNNLFFSATHCDMGYIIEASFGKEQSAGDGKALLELWRFHHNRRDFSGTAVEVALPTGPDDAQLKRDELTSMSADDLDRIRPGKESPLALQGAGTSDPALPRYIGALPRAGDPAWDWDRTWRARVKRGDERK